MFAFLFAMMMVWNLFQTPITDTTPAPVPDELLLATSLSYGHHDTGEVSIATVLFYDNFHNLAPGTRLELYVDTVFISRTVVAADGTWELTWEFYDHLEHEAVIKNLDSRGNTITMATRKFKVKPLADTPNETGIKPYIKVNNQESSGYALTIDEVWAPQPGIVVVYTTDTAGTMIPVGWVYVWERKTINVPVYFHLGYYVVDGLELTARLLVDGGTEIDLDFNWNSPDIPVIVDGHAVDATFKVFTPIQPKQRKN